MRTGFARYALNQRRSFIFASSPLMPVGDSKTRRAALIDVSALISLARCHPSMPGIRRSTRARRNAPGPPARPRRAASASSPPAASSTMHPQERRYSERIPRAVALSSTMRTGSPAKKSAGTAAYWSLTFCLPTGRLNQKREPLPSPLSTPISPPMSSTSLREMARPSPDPPYLRVEEESSCVKFWKRPPTLSAGMPMPVSRTENSSSAEASSSLRTATDTTTSPAWVNFTALLTRFTSTWRTRTGSPRTRVGAWAGRKVASSSPFLCASSAFRSAAVSMTAGR